MKVKVSVMREIIVEVDENVVNLANWYDNNSDWRNVPDSLVNKAIKAVENATGLSFGDESAEETITSVCKLDGEAILEW